jgi:hypothetical protein
MAKTPAHIRAKRNKLNRARSARNRAAGRLSYQGKGNTNVRGRGPKTARQIAASKNNLAIARLKRGRGGGRGPATNHVARNTLHNQKINKKISKVKGKGQKKIQRQADIVQRNQFTHVTQGGVYLNATGVRAYQKGVKIHNKTVVKVNKLKAKKR